MIVGLTGGLAAGKSSAAAIFAALGAAVIDADDIGRELTCRDGAALPKLRAVLGEWIFAADGTFDRAKVRARVFSDPRIKAELESVLHPMIEMQMRRRMREVAAPYIVLVIPLLLETGVFAAECDRVVVVDCAVETQIARAVGRGMNETEARAIIAAQMPRAKRISQANDSINNDGDAAALEESVRAHHREFLLSAKRESSDA